MQFVFRCVLRWLVTAGLAGMSLAAQAALFKGEALDKVADIMAIVVLLIVPPIVIAIFWLVHVLPEKIAHKKHHPQTDAITTLCLLSLFFGGLLWPLAWLWAYSKPVLYKAAYGTDKSDEFHEKERLAAAEKGLQRIEAAEKADINLLLQRIAALEARLDQKQGGVN